MQSIRFLVYCFYNQSVTYPLIFFFFPSSQEALDIVRICKEDQEQVFSMLAAVLWLGNISFQVMDDNHVEVLDDEGKIYIIGLTIFLWDILHDAASDAVALLVWILDDS